MTHTGLGKGVTRDPWTLDWTWGFPCGANSWNLGVVVTKHTLDQSIVWIEVDLKLNGLPRTTLEDHLEILNLICDFFFIFQA